MKCTVHLLIVNYVSLATRKWWHHLVAVNLTVASNDIHWIRQFCKLTVTPRHTVTFKFSSAGMAHVNVNQVETIQPPDNDDVVNGEQTLSM